jgi:hypothetical protein
MQHKYCYKKSSDISTHTSRHVSTIRNLSVPAELALVIIRFLQKHIVIVIRFLKLFSKIYNSPNVSSSSSCSLYSLCSLPLATHHYGTLTSHHNDFWLELETFIFSKLTSGYTSGTQSVIIR